MTRATRPRPDAGLFAGRAELSWAEAAFWFAVPVLAVWKAVDIFIWFVH